MHVTLAPVLLAGVALARPPLLAAPQGLTVTAAYGQTTLAWSASVGARGYDIYRGTAAGREDSTPIARGVTGPPYVDTGLTNGTRYYYKVKAVGSMGPSAASQASGLPSISTGAGYYLETYWAGNSVSLLVDDNGAYKSVVRGAKGRGGTSTNSAEIVIIFTYQPANANDKPPSCVILKVSHRNERRAGRSSSAGIHYSAVNNPGLRFTGTRDFTPPADIAAPRTATPARPMSVSTAPAFPPYVTNPYLFSGRAEAIRALQSPDLLLRRSGVEWLGDWTQTDGGGGPVGRDAKRRAFSRMIGLVPALTRGVREMPGQDSQQAARLLVLIGPRARPAIPAVCAALASPAYGGSSPKDVGDFVARADLLNSLTHLCGGPYALAPTLTGLLYSPDPETRRAAASALRFCDDPTFLHIAPPPSGAYPYLSPEEDREWHRVFLDLSLPEVLLRLDDDAGAVRLAAAQALEHWTNFPDAPWPLARVPLARVASSADPALRLTALRTLAFMPGDLSPVAPALRDALHGEAAGRPWALAALSHAAWTGRARTLDAFLPDLAAPDAARRRTAAADLRLAAGLLWDGGFWPGPYPLPEWTNDSRLFRVSTAPDATAAASRMRLLATLVRAAADRDAAVRSDAASSLEQIGKATDRMQGFGWRGGNDVGPPTAAVTAALAQAASFLQETDPTSAKRLEDLRARITAPHSVF